MCTPAGPGLLSPSGKTVFPSNVIKFRSSPFGNKADASEFCSASGNLAFLNAINKSVERFTLFINIYHCFPTN